VRPNAPKIAPIIAKQIGKKMIENPPKITPKNGGIFESCGAAMGMIEKIMLTNAPSNNPKIA
jgi:hypothetical protein